MSLDVQFFTMGMMLASGLVLGFAYDLCTVVSQQARFPRWLISITDLCYWIAATLFVFYVLYRSNFGEVRLFVFIGLLLGVSLYYLWVSSFSVQAIQTLLRMLVRFVRLLIHVWHWAIVKPLILLYRILGLFLSFLASTAIFLYKIVVQLIYPLQILSLWLMRFMRVTSVVDRMKRWLNKWIKRGKQ